MELLIISFFAGILTVLSPCVFTLLPVILGGTIQTNNMRRHFVIIISLMVSIFIFTFLLKASTNLISVPQTFWNVISGMILIFLGFITIFPNLWATISYKLKLSSSSEKLLQESLEKSENSKSLLPDILTGAALGPVFSSCSPTFAIIIATVLPASLIDGVINLIAYVVGLGFILLLISIFGRRIIEKLKWATNPNSKFKKILGIIFIIIGVLIIFGIDKQIQALSLENEGFLNITRFEIDLLSDNKK